MSKILNINNLLYHSSFKQDNLFIITDKTNIKKKHFMNIDTN